MELKELSQLLKAKKGGPVWLIHGEEQWFIEEATAMILKASLRDMNDPALLPMLLTRIDGGDSQIGAKDVVGACRSMGLFNPSLAVLLRQTEMLEKKKSERDELVKYIQAPVPESILILKANASIDGRSALVKAVKKHGTVLSYPNLNKWKAEDWLSQRVRAFGLQMDRASVALLVDFVGPNLMLLQNTLEQLRLFVLPGKQVKRQDVEFLLSSTRSHTVFEVVDGVAAKDAAGAIQHMRVMLEQREPAPAILHALIRHFRQLIGAKSVLFNGGNLQDIQQQLNVHPFVAKKLGAQVAHFETTFLQASFESFFQVECQLRENRTSASAILENLIVKLCAA